MAYIGNSPGVSSQRVVTTFTATAGQTVFTPTSGYSLGYCDVFLNGVKLVVGDDYTASNGVSITLTSGAAVGDSVEVVAFIPRGLSDGYTKSEADARNVLKTGGTMTGALVIGGVDDGGKLTLSGAAGLAGNGVTLYETSTGTNKRIRISQDAGQVTYNATFSTGGNAHVWQVGNAEAARIDSAGRVTMPYQPYFHVGASNGQSYSSGIPGTYIPASTSVTANVGGHLNISNGVFTAPVTGNYLFTWVLLIQNAPNGAQSDPRYYVNGNSFFYGNRDIVGSPNTFGEGFIVQKAAITRRLAVGDTFYVTGHLSTGTWQFYSDANWTHYTGVLLG